MIERPRDPESSGGDTPRRRSIWPMAIVIGLIVVAIVNVVFVVIAVRGGEPVVESYQTGRR